MAYNYAKARKIAARSIQKYGGEGSLVLKGVSGGYDNNGDVIPAQPDQTVYGLITPPVLYNSGEINGDTIIKGDSWVYFDSDQDISTGMQTTLNGVTFRVIDIQTVLDLDGVSIYKKLSLRV